MESCAVTWYNQEKLVLFIVSKVDLVKDCIFKELQKHLPAHALPDDTVLIDSLPFTCHGKVTQQVCWRALMVLLNQWPQRAVVTSDTALIMGDPLSASLCS